MAKIGVGQAKSQSQELDLEFPNDWQGPGYQDRHPLPSQAHEQVL